MTIDEALGILDDNWTSLNTHGNYTEEEEGKALDMAIKALKIMQGIENAYMVELLKTPLERGEKLYDE